MPITVAEFLQGVEELQELVEDSSYPSAELADFFMEHEKSRLTGMISFAGKLEIAKARIELMLDRPGFLEIHNAVVALQGQLKQLLEVVDEDMITLARHIDRHYMKLRFIGEEIAYPVERSITSILDRKIQLSEALVLAEECFSMNIFSSQGFEAVHEELVIINLRRLVSQ